MITVGIDPDVKLSGWGQARNGKLTDCGLSERSFAPPSDLTLIECPQSRQDTPNENDLIALARVVGRWERSFDGFGCVVVISPNWTHSIAKPIRHQRLWIDLSEPEKALVCAALNWKPNAVWRYIEAAVYALARRQKPKYSWQGSELLDGVDIAKRGEALTRYEIGVRNVPRATRKK
jgi:hypothetical protein